MSSAAMSSAAPPPAGAAVTLVAPPPSDPPDVREHGGLKLDWHTEVGRTGMLLEWRPVGREADAGVPLPVVGALAAGLCAVTTVAGCTLDFPAAVGAHWTAVPGGHAVRFAGRRVLGFGPLPVGVLASRAPAVVARFFDDDTFVWTHETQLLLLAPPDTLPALDRALVSACLAVPIEASLAQLAAAGIIGLARAGVDGDVAGLYLPDPAWRQTVVGALAGAVTAAGLRWGERDGTAHGSAHTPARTADGPA